MSHSVSRGLQCPSWALLGCSAGERIRLPCLLCHMPAGASTGSLCTFSAPPLGEDTGIYCRSRCGGHCLQTQPDVARLDTSRFGASCVLSSRRSHRIACIKKCIHPLCNRTMMQQRSFPGLPRDRSANAQNGSFHPMKWSLGFLLPTFLLCLLCLLCFLTRCQPSIAP